MSLQKVYGLSTARAGSKSPPKKNLVEINGKPIFLHNLIESTKTPEILKTFITTDIPEASDYQKEYNYQVVYGFKEMHDGSMSHTQVIYHALLEIEKVLGHQLDILVVMLGNTINMDRNIVKEGLNYLQNDSNLDSVITVIKANHFNPIRAYKDDGNGLLTSFLDQDLIKEKMDKLVISDKNSVGDILFQNGLWICRRQSIIDAQEKNKGLLPFPWFGDNIKYIIQEPHLQEIDDFYQINLLRAFA